MCPLGGFFLSDPRDDTTTSGSIKPSLLGFLEYAIQPSSMQSLILTAH